MIIRNARDIKPNVEEIMLKVSFTPADVRQWVAYHYQLIGLLEFSKEDFVYFLKHTYLQFFADKWQDAIITWGWDVATRHNFVTNTESGYIVSVRHILKNSGRKKNNPYFVGQ